MAYDPVRQLVVLFGGYGSGYLGDTWEWNGSNWLQRSPPLSPSTRTNHAMAYDLNRQKLVLFGGIAGSNLGDTWEWNGANWIQQSPIASPSPRYGHVMAYDADRKRVVLFGGSGVSVNLGDMWRLGLPPVSANATSYGSGCGVPPLSFVVDPTGRPLLGQVASAAVVDSPTPFAWVAMGWSNQFFGPYALPVTLTGIGMPGCNLLQSADILGLGTSPLTTSTLSFTLAIPNVPSLLATNVYIQAYALAPGVNPLQLAISNGIDWLLGDI